MPSEHFVKVYGTILDSSIWAEADSTRILWITMLAMADSTGYIEAAVPGLAGRARITLEETEAALELFQSPDTYSKNQDNDGRRVEKADRGWQLLNYQDYRDMRTEAQVRRAERQARWRAGKKAEEERLRVDGVDTDHRLQDSRGERGEGRGERVVPEKEGSKGKTSTSLVKMNLVPTRDRPILAKSIIDSLENIGQMEIAKKEVVGLQVISVFAYWVAKMGKDNSRTKLTLSRWTRLEKYIKDYGIETCLYAIDGALIHPHMNQDGKTFHEFPEIFMNKPEGPDRVEKLSEYARKKDRHPKHRFLEKHPELEGVQ